jgi:predicted DNA-binding transcriptional regulator AlpA
MATFLRIGALADRLGISVRTVHDRVRGDPHFPKPVKLGSAPQSPLGFVVSEVETYETRLMAARGTQESSTPGSGAPVEAV